jgi:hypothetical protein
MDDETSIHRRADGHIDYDRYRAEAAALRTQAKRDMMRRLLWAVVRSLRPENRNGGRQRTQRPAVAIR